MWIRIRNPAHNLDAPPVHPAFHFHVDPRIRISLIYFALYVFQLMKLEGGEVGLCVCETGTGLLCVHDTLIVVDH
jgi:hypothetical protein